MNSKTPDILISALRQYQHNDCSGLLAGFDYDETMKIVSAIQQHFIKQACAAIDEQPTLSGSMSLISKEDAKQAIREKLK